MQFYNIRVTADEEVNLPQNCDKNLLQSFEEDLCMKSEAYYQQCGRDHYFFGTNISNKTMDFIGIFKTKMDVEIKFKEYLKNSGLKIRKISVEETTLRLTKILLSLSSKRGFVSDKDEILKRFDLDRLCMDYSEELLNRIDTKESLINKSKSKLFEETLIPEIERIYTESPVRGIKGHPVHYLVCSDDCSNRKEICKILLESLYANERIQSKRFCYIDFSPIGKLLDFSYDTFYRSCEGGAIIVDYTPINDDYSDVARPGGELIEKLCETAKKYRNSVLTIFCIPEECSKARNTFLEKLIDLPLVELREDKVSGNRAKKYLRILADEHGITPDSRLYAQITDKTQLYRAVQLKHIFTQWYNHKLLYYVYPQYKKAKITTENIIAAKPKGSAVEELNEMIGLAQAKAVIYKALNYYKVQKLYKDKGIPNDRPAMHMVFKGNPGTAKTTVARLFARIMRDNGLLDKGDLYEVGRADLVGKYVGWTAQMVKEKFKLAKGGVLFIDEAYSLIDDKCGLYGDEAINTIVQEMENNRENMIVIFAGYPDKMEQFLSRNPGLRSRIAFHVPFLDYDTEELAAIAKLIADKQGLKFTEGFYSKLFDAFDLARQTENFGNGRYVRNLIEQARMEQANRIVQMNYEDVTQEVLQTLTADDMPYCDIARTDEKRSIGF